VGWNPTQGMDLCACVYSVFVLSRVSVSAFFFSFLVAPTLGILLQVAALRRANHSSKESYRLCKKDFETEGEARAKQKSYRVIAEWMNE
jgi:hypothetical protein